MRRSSFTRLPKLATSTHSHSDGGPQSSTQKKPVCLLPPVRSTSRSPGCRRRTIVLRLAVSTSMFWRPPFNFAIMSGCPGFRTSITSAPIRNNTWANRAWMTSPNLLKPTSERSSDSIRAASYCNCDVFKVWSVFVQVNCSIHFHVVCYKQLFQDREEPLLFVG